MNNCSAAVVGSGPNGLAAAITLARAGCDVTLFETAESVGGGMRSGALTLPGFVHDICSAIHPLGIASPFFRSLPGALPLQWVHAPAEMAHPLDDGPAILLERSLDDTGRRLGTDAHGYHDLFAPMVATSAALTDALLDPLLPPRHPFMLARFGVRGLRSVRAVATHRFRGTAARALFGGLGAHSVLPFDAAASASFALMLGMLAHTTGWPLPRGGAQSIARALAGYFTSIGGKIVTGHRVATGAELSGTRLVLFDTDPRQFIAIAGDRLPSGYCNRLARYRFGPAAFKVDWALDGPIPWRAVECGRAATVHLGGTFEEIAASEALASTGGHADRPFVFVVQPSLFDDSRAPAGQHTAWAYCHVPNGSTVDMTDRIERQVERFAPGFRDLILGRHVMPPAALERHDANFVGGDIVGGSNHLWQLLARPVLRIDPYATPIRGWFLCSASTPPGGGVHGMCGYHAARSALRSIGVTP